MSGLLERFIKFVKGAFSPVSTEMPQGYKNCEECNGQGVFMIEKCPDCKGEGIVKMTCQNYVESSLDK